MSDTKKPPDSRSAPPAPSSKRPLPADPTVRTEGRRDLARTQQMSRPVSPLAGNTKQADAVLQDIGSHLRRVRAAGPVRDGLPSVWHQSKLRTDLVSWHRADDSIVRHEFSFFGKTIEWTPETIRTGDLPTSTEETVSTPKSELLRPHRDPSLLVIETAITILKACPRDFFTQHLLAELTAFAAAQDNSHKRTAISGLDIFRSLEKALAEEAEELPAAQPRKMNPTYVAAGIFVVAVLIAAVAFWLAWSRPR